MKRFVMGDIHGGYRAMLQCFERSGFDYDNDMLIFLGDFCDGWSQSREVLHELMKIKNLVKILGNHDVMMRDATHQFMIYREYDLWLRNGGQTTLNSFGGKSGITDEEKEFIASGECYFVLDNKCFVHAGIPTWRFHSAEDAFKMDKVAEDDLIWDRSLASRMFTAYKTNMPSKLSISFDEVYVGHTPVNVTGPLNVEFLWFMDSGAGWDGVLSIMDIDTKEYWVSDVVKTLYPGETGRH